ncbi:hypothetical protein N7451_012176 [Penicillium sp. IBT 35674x]|nr:hypothetical protein N7451_012176 [Penicillium sp. IBT 35674x]
MAYNYSHAFIEDISGFPEYESAPLESEWAPLDYGQSSRVHFTNATPIPDNPNTSRSLNAKVPIPRISTPGIAKAHSRAPIKIPKVPQVSYGSVFSLGAFDCTEQDLNQDSRLQLMGFIGEPSEMACLYRLKRELEGVSSSACNQSISRMNYFLDDSDFAVDAEVDLSKWPSRAAADFLVHHYFNVIHPTFPAIGKVAFTSQYRNFHSRPNVRPGSRWRAVLNMIFAVAARHLLLTGDEPSVESEDHMALKHPDLQQVQIEGLMSFTCSLLVISIDHGESSALPSDQPSQWESTIVTLRENMATMCVRMAKSMIDILPDKPDMAYLDNLPPWWIVFHYLMQSIVVLLIELFTRTQTGTPEAVGILKNIGKATGWLEIMSSRDRSSKRAWVVCMDLLSAHWKKLELEADSEK